MLDDKTKKELTFLPFLFLCFFHFVDFSLLRVLLPFLLFGGIILDLCVRYDQ